MDSQGWSGIYRKGVGVVYQMEDDLPLVGQVNGISVVNGGKVFLEVDCFAHITNHTIVYYNIMFLRL